MAIASLTNIATSKYAGGANLSLASGLGTDVYNLVAKVNAIIADLNAGALDVLEVGGGITDYYAGNDSWMSIDGTNPPTVSAFRMIDTDTAAYGTVRLTGGALVVS